MNCAGPLAGYAQMCTASTPVFPPAPASIAQPETVNEEPSFACAAGLRIASCGFDAPLTVSSADPLVADPSELVATARYRFALTPTGAPVTASVVEVTPL